MFALADAQGTIVLPGGHYQVGQKATPSEIAGGVPINETGTFIGTALLPGGPLPWSAEQQEYVRRTHVALALAAGAGVLLASLVGLVLARGISRPLRLLTSAVQRLRHEERVSVPVNGSDELATLAQGFNQMSEDLARSQQARRQMTADIAHELRNPLTIITGYVEALRDGELAPTTDRLNAVLRQARRLGRAVDDLRTLSLADIGGLTLLVAPLDPVELLQATVNSYAVQAQQANVALTWQAQGELGEIQGDEERLSQVLSNLVSNALRHTPAGGSVHLESHLEGSWLVLTVADTGEGIAPDELPHIFDRLFRAGQPAERDRSGSGLGLAIVQALVSAHRGTIEAQSRRGVGTTFTIRLPATAATTTAADEHTPELVASA